MINNLAPTPPPPVTDAALAVAVTLLQVASDPAGTRERLNQLLEQEEQVRAATAEHDAAAQRAQNEQAKLDGLRERERKIMDLENEIAAVASRTDAAHNAVRRDELDRREGALAARERELNQRIESYRQALGA